MSGGVPYAEVIEGAIVAVLDGRAENDAFNELVLVSQTDPQAIVWLRAWFRYMRQGGSSYGMDTVVSALRNELVYFARLEVLSAPNHTFGINHQFVGDTECHQFIANLNL